MVVDVGGSWEFNMVKGSFVDEIGNAAELKAGGGGMRHAKVVLIIYLLASLGAFMATLVIIVHTSSIDASGYDGSKSVYGASEIYDQFYYTINILLIYFVFLMVMIMYGFVCFIRSHAKLSYATAVVYLLIVFTAFFMGSALELDIIGRLYSWHPEWCLNPLKSGQRATVCYEKHSTAGGSLPRIVYNPDDEMSLSESQWPKDVEQMFGGNLWTVRIARHIYLQDYANYDPD